MATTSPIMINETSVSQTVPPSFSWTAQGGSAIYPNNSFQLVVYDDELTEVFRSSTFTSTSYTLTQNDWQSVLYSHGRTYYVAVSAMQTANPITGEYISAFATCLKPSPTGLLRSINMLESDRYIERVDSLQPSQYVDYSVILQSGTKLIQTFGPLDTVIEIYDASDALLNESDDQGYENNSLVTLNVASNNAQYKIRVYFYDCADFGQVKLVIVPAFLFRENNVSSIYEYEDILEIHTYHNFTYSCYCANGHMSILRYSPPVSGRYYISLSSEFDNYLYVIDPRSTEIIKEDIDFNDDLDEDDRNAYLTGYFEEGVEYFIVFGQYDPSAPFTNYDEGDDITVMFRYYG